jgi:hypothetical protein
MIDDLVNRLNTSVEFLKDGMAFKVGQFVIGLEDPNTIYVNGSSDFYHIENLSQEIATKELADIKLEFEAIMSKASNFLNYLKNKSIEYNLLIDTGTAGVLMAKEKNGSMEFFF